MSKRSTLGFAEGILVGMSKRTSPEGPRVFDWDKAARLIRDRKPTEAEAGLAEDWSHTGGSIYANGAPVPKDDTYVYLASNWATPMLVIDGEEIECYVAKSETKWDSGTYWPKSALKILKGKTK